MKSYLKISKTQELFRFLRLLREEDGVRISLRNVSLSTCGIVPRMYDLAKEGLPVTLCVSLHAPPVPPGAGGSVFDLLHRLPGL